MNIYLEGIGTNWRLEHDVHLPYVSNDYMSNISKIQIQGRAKYRDIDAPQRFPIMAIIERTRLDPWDSEGFEK